MRKLATMMAEAVTPVVRQTADALAVSVNWRLQRIEARLGLAGVPEK